MTSYFDDIEKIFHHTFYNELRRAPEENSVIIALPPLASRSFKEKMCQIWFECLCIPSLLMANQATLALMGQGKTSGLVVLSGAARTFVVPVYCRHALDYATVVSPLAGTKIDEFIQTQLASSQTDVPREIARDLKHKLCYVAADHAIEMKKSPKEIEKEFELPDGSKITVDRLRFNGPEILFNGAAFGFNSTSLQSNIQSSVTNCHVDIQPYMYKHIHLAGGSVLFPGFAERLRKELKKVVPKETDFKVLDPPSTAIISTWIGGSTLGEFRDMFVGKEQYDETGPTVVRQFY